MSHPFCLTREPELPEPDADVRLDRWDDLPLLLQSAVDLVIFAVVYQAGLFLPSSLVSYKLGLGP